MVLKTLPCLNHKLVQLSRSAIMAYTKLCTPCNVSAPEDFSLSLNNWPRNSQLQRHKNQWVGDQEHSHQDSCHSMTKKPYAQHPNAQYSLLTQSMELGYGKGSSSEVAAERKSLIFLVSIYESEEMVLERNLPGNRPTLNRSQLLYC